MRRILLLTALLGASTIGCEGPTGPAGPPGADGSSCSVTDNGDGSYTIACTGGAPVTVSNGVDGANGSSCDVTDNFDGTFTIACTDGNTVTLANGTDGSNGTNGTSCTVVDNHDGTSTIACTDGNSVTVSNGADGGNVAVGGFHGTDFMQSTGEFATGKYLVKATLTGATADAAGVLTVDLAVEDLAGEPVTAVPSVSAIVAKLAPPPAGEASNVWVPYVTRVETVSTVGDWPNPVGTTALQGNAESNGTFTNHGDGTYTYVFATNLATATAGGAPVGYDRSLLHRVSVMMGGHDGPTADANLDFVPDGSAATQSRALVETASCKACHGEEFHGHGGNRLTVENCATCHTAGMTDANGGESLDLKVMIHKIHAGGELRSLPGADGIVWDNPATPADESADNGEYAIWGYRNARHEWWKAEFPAVISNCRKCHQGAGAQVDGWSANPSRAACGSCHDTVNWATGANHDGGQQADDSMCTLCHKTGGFAKSVGESHDWLTKDPRSVPEFVGEITFTPPANGSYFTGSEAPVVTIVLKDPATGLPIDHNTVREDTSAEGCLTTGCPPADGNFTVASFFVHGPRARRVPVLTTAARAQVLSSSAGPFDLSAAGATLVLKVDAGQDLVMRDVTGGDFLAVGTITVPVSAGTFAGGTANVTAGEIVAWLNGNVAFGRRAIATLDPAGRVGIRSRNLGRMHAVQLQASAVTTAAFAGDVTAHLPTGSTASNNTSQRANPANNDPKVSWSAGAITYQLDPVTDLEPGTYVASIEFTDRGRISATNYRTPTVAKATFQVKTAAIEKPVARNCSSCHQGPDGKGFVLDFSRHYKIFSDDALDQCGACHDYQPQLAAGAGWTGARPISKRVHAVHFGSSLVTPLLTVDYSNGDPIPGRNWDITFPQDVRNCQACHPDGTSSGTWAIRAARLPCLGCHDSDAAKAHMKLQTWDPTPTDPWSGDEEESCQACH